MVDCLYFFQMSCLITTKVTSCLSCSLCKFHNQSRVRTYDLSNDMQGKTSEYTELLPVKNNCFGALALLVDLS